MEYLPNLKVCGAIQISLKISKTFKNQTKDGKGSKKLNKKLTEHYKRLH